MATWLTTRTRLGALAILVVAALALTLLPGTTLAAHADQDLETEFVAALNRERAAAGLPELSVAGDLTAVARDHSQVMSEGRLHHNPQLGEDVSGWRKVGENVGRGREVGAVHEAFMDSEAHRANILDAGWSQVGIGVVVVDGQVWVTQVFRAPTGTQAAASALSALLS